MDPRAARDAPLSDRSTAAVQSVLRRQPEFDSADAALQRYRAAPAFADWTEPSLRAYIQHGFATLEDGRVRLRCTPEIESAITLPICEAMEQVTPVTSEATLCLARGNRLSGPYRDHRKILADLQGHGMRGRSADPARKPRFDGVGHCVGQEDPKLLLDAASVRGINAFSAVRPPKRCSLRAFAGRGPLAKL